MQLNNPHLASPTPTLLSCSALNLTLTSNTTSALAGRTLLSSPSAFRVQEKKSMESLSLKPLNQSYPAIFLVATGALLFLVYIILLNRRNSGDTRIAPEPAGAWPLIGHLHLLSPPNLSHKTFGNLADKYGPVYTIRLGLHKALVINSWEAAKECFTTNDRALATRPSSLAVKTIGYNYATFAFTFYGSYWREVRRIVILEILSNRRLDLLKHVRISEVNTAMKELYETWRVNCENGSDQYALVEMKEWFDDLTLNVIGRMIAGKRCFGSKLDNSEGKRLQKGIKDFFYLAGSFVLADLVPFLGWLDFQGHEKAMKRTAQEFDSILEGWLQEHKQKKLAGGAKVDEDFMDVMLSILEDNKFSDYDADTVNKATCLNLIFAAADTTTITMTWALSLLLNNRPTLKKAQDEIDATVGKDRHVCVTDIEKLVYLQAIVKETLRLYPGAPLSVQHEAREDCTVAGYHVKAGTRLITNIWKIQQDPRIWSDPSMFQPERFLTAQANVDVRGQHFEFIPFGSGRRSCPGISFALQVVHLALARLLQSFEFETPSNQKVDMTETPGMTNPKATPLQLRITPRLCSDLY